MDQHKTKPGKQRFWKIKRIPVITFELILDERYAKNYDFSKQYKLCFLEFFVFVSKTCFYDNSACDLDLYEK